MRRKVEPGLLLAFVVSAGISAVIIMSVIKLGMVWFG